MRALAFKSRKPLWLAACGAATTVLVGTLIALLKVSPYWHLCTALTAAAAVMLAVNYALKPRAVVSVDGDMLVLTARRNAKTEIPLRSVESVLYAAAFRYDGFVIVDTPSGAYKLFVKDAAKACADIREEAEKYMRERGRK